MLEQSRDHLAIRFAPGDTGRFHWLWLRDHCRCPRCFNSNSLQKYFDNSVLPLDLAPQRVAREGAGVAITWPDGHESAYDLDWLRRHDYSRGVPPRPEAGKPSPEPWGSDRLPPSARFDSAAVAEDDGALSGALDALLRFGVVVLEARGRPAVPFDRLSGRVSGFLDRTYFGEYFDLNVKPEETTDSVAFSTRELPLHTDIPYYAPPPDFQFLYGLDVSPECAARGIGSTRFVDGLAAALALRSDDPGAFAVLTRTAVVNRAEYPLAQKIYENVAPIISLAPDGSIARLLNNPSKTFFDTVAFDDMLPLYAAYKDFKDRLTTASPSHSHTWSDGDMVIWDNRRVLHGRGEFGSQGVKRILRGGYMAETEVLARRRAVDGASRRVPPTPAPIPRREPALA